MATLEALSLIGKRARTIRELKIKRVDLVDRPANQYAKVLLYKRADDEKDIEMDTLKKRAMDLIEADAQILIKANPKLTKFEATMAVMETEAGKAAYEAYSGRGDREADVVADVIFKEANELVKKGLSKSLDDAIGEILSDQDVYLLYREKTIV